MSNSINEDKQAGFTLIEILVATSILVIVMSIIYSAFRASAYNTRGVEQSTKFLSQVRTLFERVTDDLESITQDETRFLIGHEVVYPHQKTEVLSFITSANIVFSNKDYPANRTKVSYFLQKDRQTGLLTLYRSDVPLLPDTELISGDQSIILAQNLAAFNITYTDINGNESAGWEKTTEVDTPDNVQYEPMWPALIRFEVEFPALPHQPDGQYFSTAIALPTLGSVR